MAYVLSMAKIGELFGIVMRLVAGDFFWDYHSIHDKTAAIGDREQLVASLYYLSCGFLGQ